MAITKDHKPASFKTPLAQKKTADSKEPHRMLFVFVLDGGVTEAYVSEDPVFADVVGYQRDTTFVTEKMYDHMKEDIVKSCPDNAEAMECSKYSAVDCEEMSGFVYSFAECMEECYTGETADAYVVVKQLF